MAKARTQTAHRRTRAADQERWQRLFIVGGVVAVILIAAGIIGFGWYQTQIKPGGKVVLRVSDTEYTLRHLERRMELMLQENTFFTQSQSLLQTLPDTVLEQLEREAKLLEGATQLNNITVSDKEVDDEIAERGSVSTEGDRTAFVTSLQRQVDESGLKLGEFRQMVRAELLEEKARNYFLYVAPQSEPQVRARWILSEDESAARQALERLNAGQDFAAVAREVSKDTVSAEKGGELDWRPRGAFLSSEIEDFLFEGQPGQRSEIIDTPAGAYIVELLERLDDRPLDDQQRQLVASRELGEWLNGLDGTLHVAQDFTEDDRNRALNDIL